MWYFQADNCMVNSALFLKDYLIYFLIYFVIFNVVNANIKGFYN